MSVASTLSLPWCITIKMATSLYTWGFPGGASGKEPSGNAGDARDVGSILGSGRSPGGEHGNSSVPAWVIPWTGEPGGLWSIGSQIDTTEVTQHAHTFLISVLLEEWPTLQCQATDCYQSMMRFRVKADRELCSKLCGSLVGRGIWRRMDMCICMPEPLCCTWNHHIVN